MNYHETIEYNFVITCFDYNLLATHPVPESDDVAALRKKLAVRLIVF